VGDAEPKTSRLVAIADAAGVTVEWLATGRGPQPQPQAARSSSIDAELNARIVEAVAAIYKECGAAISHRDLGRVTAGIYNEIIQAGLESAEERTGALRLAAGQLRRRLLTPGPAETKRLA